ncbi:hypothetical protein BKA70DRAFT_1242414 [Coprinopsis sp. MPI-PUGE-AT-0042]|nr:hypothetical protein BKA70DRAFT_1242414 [Coprinopsis sp. MPI-PUGE-AT-0042]
MPTIQLAYTASIGYAKTGEEVLRGPLRIWVACMLRQRIPYSKRATEKLRSLVPGFLEVDLSLMKPPAQEGGARLRFRCHIVREIIKVSIGNVTFKSRDQESRGIQSKPGTEWTQCDSGSSLWHNSLLEMVAPT